MNLFFTNSSLFYAVINKNKVEGERGKSKGSSNWIFLKIVYGPVILFSKISDISSLSILR